MTIRKSFLVCIVYSESSIKLQELMLFPIASLDGTVRVWGLRMKTFVKTQTFSGYHSDWVSLYFLSSVISSLLSRFTLSPSLLLTIALRPGAMTASW